MLKKLGISLGIAFLILVAVVTLMALFRGKAYDGWTLTCYADDSGNQTMFFAFSNKKEQKLILIDGGWRENETQVRNVIKENNNVVDAWIVTHYHSDHVGAFNAIYQNPDGITIKKIYDSPLDEKMFHKVKKEWDNPEEFDAYMQNTKGDERITHIKRDDEITIDGLKFYFFNTYDDLLVETCDKDLPNDCSLLFKVSGEEDDILFCSDCHSKPLSEMLIKRYGEKLHAEYVQPGHHGNNSFPGEFYEVVKPNVAIFNAPEWLVNGEDYTAKDLKKYFESTNVKTCDLSTAPIKFMFR